MRLDPSLYVDLCGDARGMDCWALVAEVYRRRGVALVGFGADLCDDWKPTDEPQPGDLLLTVTGGRPHVGIVLDGATYLHAGNPGLVVVSRRGALDRAGVHVRYYRHAGAKPVALAIPPSDGQVRVVYIHDPVDRPHDRQAWYRAPGTLGALAPPGANVVMTDAGPRHLAEVADRPAGDVAVYARLPEGAELVLAIVGLALSATSAVIGILSAPGAPEARNDPSSPTFALDGIRNTAVSGIVQPVVYGDHRAAGNFISAVQKVDAEGRAVFYGLILLSRGPVQSIGGLTADADELTGPAIPDGIKIDDNQASAYDCKVSVRLGSSEQTTVPGFSETASTVTYTATVDQPSPPANWGNAQPFGHETTQPVTGFDVLLSYPAGLIGYSTSNNNPYSITMTYAVRYRVKGTTTWTTETWTHSGQRNASVNYQFTKRGIARDIYEIQLQFVSAVTPGGNAQGNPDTIYGATVAAVNEVIAQGFTYPGCALLGVRLVGSDQLAGGVPTITAQVEGRKVWIWDGVSTVSPAFTLGYTRNPAWIILDILTNQDFGLGRAGAMTLDDVDLEELDALADYADELVDDGRGGTIPRAYCDLVVDSERSGFDLAREIAYSANARLYIANGKVRCWIDREASPEFVFTAGNCRDVKVTYTGRRTRPNAAEVQYLNAETDYDQDYATRLDDAAVLSSGEPIRKESIAGTGVTRAAHAYRLAQRAVNVSRYVSRRFEWISGPEAIHLAPGAVVYFHGSALGAGIGGRILAATSSTVKLDRTVTVSSRARLVVGSQADVIETVYIAAGTYARNTAINIVDSGGTGTTWAATPAVKSKWIIPSTSSQSVEPVQVRIESMAVTPELDTRFVGSLYDESVYNDDPGDVEEFTDDLPDPRDMPASVTGLRVTDAGLPNTDALRVGWQLPETWAAAEVWYRQAGSAAWTFHGWAREDALIPVAPGTFEVAVAAKAPGGTRQRIEDAARASCHVRGFRTPPDAPTAVVASVTAGGILHVHTTGTAGRYDIACGLLSVAEDAGPEWSGACPFTGTVTLSVRGVSATGVRSLDALTTTATWTLATSVYTEDLNQSEGPGWTGDADDLTVDGTGLLISGTSLTGTYTMDATAPTATTTPQQVIVSATTELDDVAMLAEEACFFVGSDRATTLTLAGGGPFLDGYDLAEHSTVANAMYRLDSMPGLLYTLDGPSDILADLRPTVEYDIDAALDWQPYGPPPVVDGMTDIAARVTMRRPHARYEPRLQQLNLTTLDLTDSGGGGTTAVLAKVSVRL